MDLSLDRPDDYLFVRRTGTDVIIHGHTHRPALHEAGGMRRYVLPDWELDEEPVRGGWIAIDEDGRILRVDLAGHELA